MNDLSIIIGLAMVFIFASVMTGVVRKYALKKSLIDFPNERSSHSIATPRGGGLSIAISILFVICVLYFLGYLPREYALAFAVGGIIVVITAWIDDHNHITPFLRAVAYFIAAGLAVYFLGGFEQVQLGTKVYSLGYVGSFLSVFWILWLTNLYNFMDGADGMAASEAICVSIFAGIVFWSLNEKSLAIICLAISMSSLGFICWNWPPAKIFMGDVGSCLLGFIFGVLSIVGEKTQTLMLAVWFVLLAVFVSDATFTLLSRVLKKKNGTKLIVHTLTSV